MMIIIITACGVMVIIENGHGDPEFKSWMRMSAFHIAPIPFGERYVSNYSPFWINSWADWAL